MRLWSTGHRIGVWEWNFRNAEPRQRVWRRNLLKAQQLCINERRILDVSQYNHICRLRLQRLGRYTVLLQIIYMYVISEENKLQLLYCSLAVYLLLYSALYYLHSPITASGARYRRSACIAYKSAIRSCGRGWLRYGLNFSSAWCTMRFISDKKD